MRILVTGSAGFIGHHVCKRLLQQEHEICGVDEYNAYYDVRLKEFRSAELTGLGRFREHRLDLSDIGKTSKVVAEFKPEAIVHLAAQAGVRYSLEHPEAYTRCNIDAFLSVLEACRHRYVRRLVYASSSSVYGGITQLPFSESMDVSLPVSLYAATKKANELMAHTYSHLFGFETVGLRFFTVYGTMGRPDMAMWIFTDAILNDRPIQVFNHGKMKRDFTYVDDIVAGVVASLTSPLAKKAEIYNLGNSRSEDLERLISLLEANLQKKARREYLPLQPGDVPNTFADTAKAERDLGFSPKVTLDVGVEKFITWYRESWLPHLRRQTT